VSGTSLLQKARFFAFRHPIDDKVTRLITESTKFCDQLGSDESKQKAYCAPQAYKSAAGPPFLDRCLNEAK
jgi:hypothetical protein